MRKIPRRIMSGGCEQKSVSPQPIDISKARSRSVFTHAQQRASGWLHRMVSMKSGKQHEKRALRIRGSEREQLLIVSIGPGMAAFSESGGAKLAQ